MTAAEPATPVADSPEPKRRKRRRPLPGLLGRRAAAEFLGGMGKSSLDTKSAAGLTPAPIKILGSVYYSRAELAEWCLRGCPPREVWAPLWKAILARRDAKGGR